jgi:hypothetical protein
MFIRDEVGQVAIRGRLAIENYPRPEGVVNHNRRTWPRNLKVAALIMVVVRSITEEIPHGNTRTVQNTDRRLIVEALHGMDLSLVPFRLAHWIRVLRNGRTFGFTQALYSASFTSEVGIRSLGNQPYMADNHRWLMDLQAVVLNLLLGAGYNVTEGEPYVVIEE